MTTRPLGLGVIGCGGAAVDVAAAVRRLPDARITAAHDLRPELAADIAAASGARVHPSIEALLADPAVDTVYIALPHDLLAGVARQALAAGRPALVEKPMAIDAGEIDHLDATARAAGLALGVLFELRETGPARLAARLVADGAIGTVTAVRIQTLIDKPQAYWSTGPTGRTSSPWRARRSRAGGGVVLMNSIHQLDLVHAITRLAVVRARGETGTLMTDGSLVDVEDTAAGVLRYDNGAIGSLVASAHAPGAADAETIEVDGTLGALRLPDPYVPGELSVVLRRPYGDLPAGRWVEVPAPPADPFRDAVAGFLGAVRLGGPAPVGAPEAAAAVRIVQQLYLDPMNLDPDRREP